jgi:hypothetical protein
MQTFSTRLLPMLLLATACATSSQGVPLEETSAEGHRQEAERERQEARTLEREAAQRPWELHPSYDPDRDRALGYEPANDRMDEAERRDAHAAAHAAAAAQLERFESEACAGVSQQERAACPLLGPVASIRDIRGGVRIELTAGTPIAALAASMRCHHAFARARGFSPEAASCPLYMSGVRIRLSADAKALEILGSTAAMVAEIRKRSRQEAIRAPAQATSEDD